MLFKLDHIGIAVKNTDNFKTIFHTITGIDFPHSEIVDKQKVKVSFTENMETNIELIEATSEKSPIFPIIDHPIHSFINKHGEGVHHLCFKVDNIESAIDRLKSKGIKVLSGNIFEGSYGSKIVFIDPNDTGGILIELKE